VSHIEQRLIEMEILAFELLSACERASISTEAFRLSTDQRQVFVDFAQKQSKSDKLEEWKSLPIRNPQQRQTWWSTKHEGLLMPGAAQAKQGLDHVASVGMAPAPEYAGNLQSVDRLPSLAQVFPQPPLFAASPATSVQEGPAINSPASSHDAGVAAGARASQQNQGLETPSVPLVSAAEMSPPSKHDVAADRWRKYF
jgi:hypothetical protein